MESSQQTQTQAQPIQENELVTKVKAAVKNAVIKGEFEIPVLPHVAMEVLKLVNNPNINLSQIETIVKKDQSISARIVKMANSAMFRGAMEITSLQQAMARIGLKNVKDIVVTVGVQANTFKDSHYQDILTAIWENSIGAALCSQMIAKSLVVDQEFAFLAGLFSLIGRPVLVQIVSKLEKAEMLAARNAAFYAKKPFDEKKFKVPMLREEILPLAFKEFHTIVGAAVASRWNLPASLIEVIRNFETPQKAPDNVRKLCWIVLLAHQFCKNCGFGQTATTVLFDHEETVKALELEKPELDELIKDATEHVAGQILQYAN